MLTVWLIRHGESKANAGLPTADEVTTVLTQRGLKQAERIAGLFTKSPSLIVVSPYLRSKQFAEPTIRRFKESTVAEWPVHSLICLSPARYKDKSFSERRPFVEEYWNRCDPIFFDSPDTESFAGFMARVSDFIQRLQSLQEGFIAVFTHQLFIQAVIGSLLTNSLDPSHECMKLNDSLRKTLKIPNGAVVVISWHDQDQVTFSNNIVSICI